MWPFKKRAGDNAGKIPMHALSTSEAPLDEFQRAIPVPNGLERLGVDKDPGEE